MRAIDWKSYHLPNLNSTLVILRYVPDGAPKQKVETELRLCPSSRLMINIWQEHKKRARLYAPPPKKCLQAHYFSSLPSKNDWSVTFQRHKVSLRPARRDVSFFSVVSAQFYVVFLPAGNSSLRRLQLWLLFSRFENSLNISQYLHLSRVLV